MERVLRMAPRGESQPSGQMPVALKTKFNISGCKFGQFSFRVEGAIHKWQGSLVKMTCDDDVKSTVCYCSNQFARCAHFHRRALQQSTTFGLWSPFNCTKSPELWHLSPCVQRSHLQSSQIEACRNML